MKKSNNRFVVTQEESGTIIADFNSVLKYFEKNKIRVTKKSKAIPLNVIPSLNKLLINPPKVQFKKVSLKSYPQVRGIFWLLRSSGLLKTVYENKQHFFEINLQKLKIWQKLNFIERYFYLLELWWLRSPGELIGERNGISVGINIHELIYFWSSLSGKIGTTYEKREDFLEAVYFHGNHNIALHKLFGLIEVKEYPPQIQTGWNLKKIRFTKLGKTIIATVNNSIAKNAIKGEDFFGYLGKPEFMKKLFGENFSDWKFTDFPKNIPKKTEGLVVFKVSWGSWSAKIAISSDSTWEDLSNEIFNAVEFEEWEHLYDFEIVDETGLSKRFIHPESQIMDDNEHFANVKIGNTFLEKGQEIIYTFDYGVNWQFLLIVEDVRKDKISEAEVYDERGNPPKQYPD